MSETSTDRELRVSDDERTHVVNVLQKATGRGMLDINEFSERSATALAAKTRGELNAVVADLPGLVNSSAPAAARSETLTSSMSSIRRNGAWTVPPELTVRNGMGSVRLDFREATINYPQVEIHFDVAMGSVRIDLPASATVNVEGLQVVMGSTHARSMSSAEEPGNPHFVLNGKISMGSLHMRRGKGRWSC